MDTIATVVPYVMVLLIAGIACGFINTLASSGSAISLPMLLTLGLPALAANATNRLPVLFGSLMALRTFQTQGKVDWSAAWRIVLPATVGSAVGIRWTEGVLLSVGSLLGGHFGAKLSSHIKARIWVF